jgi:excinuclease UvrABC helicase subunit UvrB
MARNPVGTIMESTSERLDINAKPVHLKAEPLDEHVREEVLHELSQTAANEEEKKKLVEQFQKSMEQDEKDMEVDEAAKDEEKLDFPPV